MRDERRAEAPQCHPEVLRRIPRQLCEGREVLRCAQDDSSEVLLVSRGPALWILRPQLVLLLIPLLLTGCTHSSVHRVARYRPHVDSAPGMTVAPATGVYVVRYAPPGEEMRMLDDSARIVRQGAPLGFDVADDGTLLAVAGGEQFLLPLRRDALRKCVWYCRTEKSSQFARGVDKVGQGAVTVAAGAGVVAGVGAVGVGAMALESLDDDECERAEQRHRHRGHHRDDRDEAPTTRPAAPRPGAAP